jgi:hypothetical protein
MENGDGHRGRGDLNRARYNVYAPLRIASDKSALSNSWEADGIALL